MNYISRTRSGAVCMCGFIVARQGRITWAVMTYLAVFIFALMRSYKWIVSGGCHENFMGGRRFKYDVLIKVLHLKWRLKKFIEIIIIVHKNILGNVHINNYVQDTSFRTAITKYIYVICLQFFKATSRLNYIFYS